jgi:NitT/TauT family transport system substrate-binding protein
MGFADKNIRKPEDIKGKTVRGHAGRLDVADLAAVPQEDDLKDATSSGRRRRADQAQRGDERQADLLLGYVMDQAIKLQDATQQAVYPIRFADYGVNMVSSGIIVQKDSEEQARRRQALPARARRARGSGEESRAASTRCSRRSRSPA